MSRLTDSPLLVFACSFLTLWVCGWAGARLAGDRALRTPESREDFNLVLAAALTLLGLIIGFTFSMAIGRFDQRKALEATEANAIGTEYLRTDLLAPEDAVRARALLKEYLAQRVLFYSTRDARRIEEIRAHTARLQAPLWNAVHGVRADAVTTLVVSGMNAVFDSQDRTQSVWWDRIPAEAWLLMILIAMLGNAMVGYAAHRIEPRRMLLLILPLVLSISFLLIADIDSPVGGLIHVSALSLQDLSGSL